MSIQQPIQPKIPKKYLIQNGPQYVRRLDRRRMFRKLCIFSQCHERLDISPITKPCIADAVVGSAGCKDRLWASFQQIKASIKLSSLLTDKCSKGIVDSTYNCTIIIGSLILLALAYPDEQTNHWLARNAWKRTLTKDQIRIIENKLPSCT